MDQFQIKRRSHQSKSWLDDAEAQSFRNAISVLWIGLEEVLDGSFLNVSWNSRNVAHDVRDRVLSVSVVHDFSEQVARLGEIAVRVVWSVSGNETCDSVGLECSVLVNFVGVKTSFD